MSSKKKNSGKLEAEQRELYDYARRRALQKKRLFQHFVIFLIGAVFLIVLNVVIGYQEDFMPLGYNWFVWAILLWAFIFLIHFFNVFVTNSFMGKEWEDRQMEKLVKQQKEKIAKMQQQVEREYPEKTRQRSIEAKKREDLQPGPENPTRPENQQKNPGNRDQNFQS